MLHALAETPWKRHAIETGMLGADGARLIDADGDGLLDVVTGWEQSGTVAVYSRFGPIEAVPVQAAVSEFPVASSTSTPSRPSSWRPKATA